MPQTVFDVGDLITSRLDIGVVPDGTTTVTVAVYRPDGTLIAGLVPSVFVNVSQKTVQWYATDTGAAGASTTNAAGDWLAVWTVTGTGASVTTKIYPVRLLPSANTNRPAWAPYLSDVADHVPWLTVDTVTPGDQRYLGTFTGATEPTDEQAQRHIDRAADLVGARIGTVPAALYPLAGRAVALEAAASLARAFPRSRPDGSLADLVNASAAALLELRAAMDAADTAPSLTPQPVAYAPEPVWYGDMDL